MAVMPREKWTDEHLDDGFARVDTDIRELRTEMNQRFDKVEGRMESGMTELRGEIKEVNGQFLALHKLLVTISIGVAATVGVALVGVFATYCLR